MNLDGKDGMMWAGSLRRFLVLVLLVLEGPPLVKYLFSNRLRVHDRD